MAVIRAITLALALLALVAAIAISACGDSSTVDPSPTSQAPVSASDSAASPAPPSTAVTVPTEADASPTSVPPPSPTAYARFPIQRPSGFGLRSADPTPIPDPTPTSQPTMVPTPTVTATPTPIATRTPTPTLSPDDPDAMLNIITLLPKDGIPAILEPTFIDAEEAWEQYESDELVLGVSINGEHKAYSVPYLSNREIVNDELGGVAIAATW